MKKVLAAVVTLALLMAMATGVSAVAEKNGEYTIPKAEKAPVIDGVKSAGEWDKALVRTLTSDNTIDPTNKFTEFPGADFYWMWDEAGLYFFADVKDNTDPKLVPSSVTSLNDGDGIQFCMYSEATVSGSNANKLFFFTLNSAGGFGLSDHFVVSDGSKGAFVTGSETAVVKNGTNYTMEGFIPAGILKLSTPSIVVAEGSEIILSNIVMARDGTNTSLYVDCDSWFDASTCNVYTLAPAEKPVTPDEPTTPVTPDEPTTPVTPDEPTTPANPATADIFVIAIVAAALSGAGIVVGKKKK